MSLGTLASDVRGGTASGSALTLGVTDHARSRDRDGEWFRPQRPLRTPSRSVCSSRQNGGCGCASGRRSGRLTPAAVRSCSAQFELDLLALHGHRGARSGRQRGPAGERVAPNVDHHAVALTAADVVVSSAHALRAGPAALRLLAPGRRADHVPGDVGRRATRRGAGVRLALGVRSPLLHVLAVRRGPLTDRLARSHDGARRAGGRDGARASGQPGAVGSVPPSGAPGEDGRHDRPDQRWAVRPRDRRRVVRRGVRRLRVPVRIGGGAVRAAGGRPEGADRPAGSRAGHAGRGSVPPARRSAVASPDPGAPGPGVVGGEGRRPRAGPGGPLRRRVEHGLAMDARGLR